MKIFLRNTLILAEFLGLGMFLAPVFLGMGLHMSFDEAWPIIQMYSYPLILSYMTIPLMKYIKSEQVKWMLWWPYLEY